LALEDHGDPQRHAVVEDDMLNVAEVWAQALATGVLDPAQPIAVVMVAILHFVPSPDAHAAVQRYRDLLAPGSLLVISHVTETGVPDDVSPGLGKLVAQYETSSTPGYFRELRDIATFFGDFDMIDPGLVWLPQWRLDEGDSPASARLADVPERSCVLGGVGWKPLR
jgi:O-methyltransferase involved in polyketide biosynthesis